MCCKGNILGSYRKVTIQEHRQRSRVVHVELSSHTALGTAVRAARKRAAWSEQELADRSGVSRVLVARVERGLGGRACFARCSGAGASREPLWRVRCLRNSMRGRSAIQLSGTELRGSRSHRSPRMSVMPCRNPWISPNWWPGPAGRDRITRRLPRRSPHPSSRAEPRRHPLAPLPRRVFTRADKHADLAEHAPASGPLQRSGRAQLAFKSLAGQQSGTRSVGSAISGVRHKPLGTPGSRGARRRERSVVHPR